MSLIPLSLVLIASLLPRSVLALDSTPVKNLVVFGDSYSGKIEYIYTYKALFDLMQ